MRFLAAEDMDAGLNKQLDSRSATADLQWPKVVLRMGAVRTLGHVWAAVRASWEEKITWRSRVIFVGSLLFICCFFPACSEQAVATRGCLLSSSAGRWWASCYVASLAAKILSSLPTTDLFCEGLQGQRGCLDMTCTLWGAAVVCCHLGWMQLCLAISKHLLYFLDRPHGKKLHMSF